MNNGRIILIVGCLALAPTISDAAPRPVADTAAVAAVQSLEMSEHMRSAVLLAKAAGAGVSFVGAALALDDAVKPAEVAIIQPVPIERMKRGEIIMFVKDECQAPIGCVMARRITEKHGSEVATEHYGRPDADKGKSIDATVVGRIAYVVDLTTGRIRDMRHDAAKEVSFPEALRRESKKWHYVGNIVQAGSIKI